MQNFRSQCINERAVVTIGMSFPPLFQSEIVLYFLSFFQNLFCHHYQPYVIRHVKSGKRDHLDPASLWIFTVPKRLFYIFQNWIWIDRIWSVNSWSKCSILSQLKLWNLIVDYCARRVSFVLVPILRIVWAVWSLRKYRGALSWHYCGF